MVVVIAMSVQGREREREREYESHRRRVAATGQECTPIQSHTHGAIAARKVIVLLTFKQTVRHLLLKWSTSTAASRARLSLSFLAAYLTDPYAT